MFRVPIRLSGGLMSDKMPGDTARKETEMPPNEHWRVLCKRASTESDPQKLLELVRKIIQLTAAEIPTNDEVSWLDTRRTPTKVL